MTSPVKKLIILGGGVVGLIQILQTAEAAVATHPMDFDVPRGGPRCVRAYVGDSVKFHWDEYHNLKKMPNESSYDSCTFSGATELQSQGWPNTATELQSQGW